MKKNILLFFVLAFLSIPVLAQNAKGNIEGKITTVDDKPASMVTVLIKGTKKTTLTEDDGSFIMRNVPAGNYELEISLVGYEVIREKVLVEANQTLNVSYKLKISDSQLQEVIIKTNAGSFRAGKTSPTLRIQTPLLEVAQNIQVVTSSALSSQQVISMSDGVIRNVSGVTRAEHWGDLYANLSARGSQIQAFRNGFNVVNSYWGPLTEDMSFVDHIEFVKGPAGFMLSSGDPSGLYNVVTKKPTGQTKGEATLTMGSYGLYRSALDLDGKLSDDGKLLYRLNVSGQFKKSFRPNEYNNRYVIAPVLSYQLDDKTKLTLEYNYQMADMSDVGSFYVFSTKGYANLPVDFTAQPAGLPGTAINDHSVYVNLQHELSKNWKLTAQVSHFLYNQKGTSSWPTVINEDGTYIRSVGIWDARSKMTMAQAFLNGDVTTGAVRHRILGGLDMANKAYMADWTQSHDLDTEDEPFDPQNPNLGVPVNGYPQFDRSKPLSQRAQEGGGLQDLQYTSLYLQDELGFFNNLLRVTLAGRYTDLQQSAYGGAPDKAKHFTPRAGISASLTSTTAIYAMYDQAFIPQTGILKNGGKVKPITGNNLEAGIKKDWMNGQWTTTLSVYRILKNNELTADPTSDPNLGLSIVLGQKEAKGVEFDLRGTILPGLNLVANYAFTESKVTKVADGITYMKVGDQVPGYAKHTANAWLNYAVQSGALKGVGVSAGFTWLIDRATYWEAAPDPSKDLNDYFKLDGGLFWEKNKLRLTANVFNILNTYLYSGSYESWMSTPAYSWQAEPPRNLRFSIAYRF
ncbi:MAG: TonB-dependent receptor [Agriterribacter sp.]